MALPLIVVVVLLAGCDPADSLTNQEYRPYLDNYQKWEITDVVSTFNALDEKRDQFNCQEELAKAHHVRWREKVGPVKVDQTPTGKAFVECLNTFQEGSGIGAGKLKAAVLFHWVNHNFLPEVEKAFNAEIEANQKRLDQAGCGGETCQLLTVVDDLAVARLGQKVSVAWQDARSACSRADFGGLSPWRLPTRDELVAIRQSGEVASDLDLATYWSNTREFDESGKINAYVLRFDVESLGEDMEPRSIGFLDSKGIPSRAKVRCVHDLGKAKAQTGEVAEMEKAVVAAGCPQYNWDEKVRVRKGYLLTWEKVVKSGEKARSVCKGLGWCGLRWRPVGRRESKLLEDDPWVGSGLDSRCLADLPESQ